MFFSFLHKGKFLNSQIKMISSWRPTHLQNELTKKNKLNALWLNHLPTKANYSNHFSNWVFQVFPTISKEKNWFQKTNKVACVRNLTICQVFKVLFSKKKKSNSKFLPSRHFFALVYRWNFVQEVSFVFWKNKEKLVFFLFVDGKYSEWLILPVLVFVLERMTSQTNKQKRRLSALKRFKTRFFV